jgi:hypothetical protein
MKTVFCYLSKKSFKVGLCLCVIFCTTSVYAQDLVSKGLDSVETIFHIKYEIPKSFKNINIFQIWTPNTPAMWNTLCCVFESKDKQCKVLYNVLPSCPEYNFITHRDKMWREFNSMLNTKDFILDNYLRVLPIEEAKKRFNADSIFLYNVPTAIDKDEEKFSHCTRMIITRQNRPILDLVWYFTDNGKKKEKKYLQKINKRIWYNDGYWNLDWQRWEEWMKTYFAEIMDDNPQIQ